MLTVEYQLPSGARRRFGIPLERASTSLKAMLAQNPWVTYASVALPLPRKEKP